jgi:hypothetical protein
MLFPLMLLRHFLLVFLFVVLPWELHLCYRLSWQPFRGYHTDCLDLFSTTQDWLQEIIQTKPVGDDNIRFSDG